MMRAAIVLMVSMAAPVLAQSELPLPPGPQWLEKADPRAVDGGAGSRYFEKDGVPDVWFRVTKQPTLRYQYDEALAAKLPYRYLRSIDDDTRPKVSEPRLWPIDGTEASSFQLERGDHLTTVFFLPAEGGDLLVEAQTLKARPIDLQTVLNTVQGAKGLRKVPLVTPRPPEPPKAPTPWGLIGAAVGVLAALGIVLLRRKK